MLEKVKGDSTLSIHEDVSFHPRLILSTQVQIQWLFNVFFKVGSPHGTFSVILNE